ncbi:MAG: metalloregulator ArsR/SmtB family transcription factor [Chitinophagales bacterium]|jgi:CRISPR type IV-associated protein Csf3|nr:winged helix-turn-helix transcriptional regulator [Bacteroidota bacterium]MBK9505162.1 winged helix-turn-helix transcriptional regulator [Bacteroidota bacterium]MBK9556728.1 winged helix-turn-helix transcriptional regulator [Bacteroidota bacterium]MBL0279060.1 winged helix-turn-helix transcriptional regulator [Bacteroidota bacterium]MBP8249840.1 winged helix-turn-helix transcriptional regulator [Chitinophagales bacterium]
METRRDIFQAIADPTRRAILTLLAFQAMTPGAIASNFDSTRQTISKHIQILTECELVGQQQKGREIYYHVNAHKINEIDAWVVQFKTILEMQFSQLDHILLQQKKHHHGK